MRYAILLVEDEAAIRRSTGRFLRLAGYDVVEAADGVEALDACATRCFDLVLADYILPRLPGPDLVRRLKEKDPAPEVLVFTGLIGPVLCPGARQILRKPVSLSEVAEAIAQALAEREVAPRAALLPPAV